MLRVGLTGGLGSGKSTVGRVFAGLGAAVIDADEVARKLMDRGEAVYHHIVEHFGQQILQADGSLDRRALAGLAFSDGPAGETHRRELNRIVHPATIAAQEEWMRGVFSANPNAVAIVESALIFEASGEHSKDSGNDSSPAEASVPGWKDRFDRIILVTAPDALKIQRFVERAKGHSGGNPTALAEDARRRIAAQIPDAQKIPLCDWIVDNSGGLAATRAAVKEIYTQLCEANKQSHLSPTARGHAETL